MRTWEDYKEHIRASGPEGERLMRECEGLSAAFGRTFRQKGLNAILAIREAQAAFAGVAEQIGVSNEEDVQALVDEVRYGTNAER